MQTVLLYYKYTALSDPGTVAAQQREICARLNLRGRVIVASEGINGTLAGSRESTQAYEAAMGAIPEFAGMEFKRSQSSDTVFPRLSVKLRPEIVSLHGGDSIPHVDAPESHLTPAQWKETLEKEKGEIILFDVRNRYEWEVGRFRGAITPPIENFRELPAALDQYSSLKDRKILMYCTGGIRCERAYGLFQKAGFKNVLQLHGGIVTYLEQFPEDHWEGECFVFDGRMVMQSPPDGQAIGKCAHTGRPSNQLVNCLHDPCHRLFVIHPDELAREPELALCPECRSRGLTRALADYKGSPARPALTKRKRRNHRKKKAAE
jgi:UPF0176 protein